MADTVIRLDGVHSVGSTNARSLRHESRRKATVAAEPWLDIYFNIRVSLVGPDQRAVTAPVL
jgi:hypothetical protein